MFKGKVIPCFTRLSEFAGMYSTISKEVFETIDYFNLLPRINGVVPFAMLGGHKSRFELSFSKIN